jgi:mannose-6-phosphate isomerase-like protein (cupin superfamily)
MLPNYDDFLIKRFEQPDEVRKFEKGKFEIVKMGSMTIGRAGYEVEHVGMVVSGCAACRMKDGRYYEMRAGDLFYIGPGHDSWVVGDERYVSLHFLGGEHYVRH